MPALVYVKSKQGGNMLMLRETDKLNIDIRRFGQGRPQIMNS